MWLDYTNYIDYYYTNYEKYTNGLSLSDINQLRRVTAIEKQIKAMAAKRNQLYATAKNEWGSQLASIFDGASRGYMNDIVNKTYSAPVVGGINVSSNISDMNVTTLTNLIQNKSNQLINYLQMFINQLSTLSEELYNEMNNPTIYQEYTQQIIAKYCLKKQIDSNSFAASVIQDFLRSDGFKSFEKGLSASTARMERVVNRFILLAAALPEWEQGIGMNYSNSRGTSGRINSAEDFWKIISQKVSGLISSAQGAVGEIAAAKAELKLISELASKTSVDVIGKAFLTGSNRASLNGFQISSNIKYKEDAKLEQFKNIKTPSSIGKSDVQMIISDDKVALQYGMSVKNYKVKKKNNTTFKTYTIHHEGNFLDLYDKVYNDNDHNFLKNLGAGHVGNSDMSVSNMDLLWQNLMKTITAEVFSDAITGNVDSNTIFVVLSGKVFAVDDILNRILGYVMNQNGYSMSYGYQNTIKRSTLLRYNAMINGPKHNMKYAMERSKKANAKIDNYLSKIKMTITLNTLTSLLIQ